MEEVPLPARGASEMNPLSAAHIYYGDDAAKKYNNHFRARTYSVSEASPPTPPSHTLADEVAYRTKTPQDRANCSRLGSQKDGGAMVRIDRRYSASAFADRRNRRIFTLA